MFRHPPQLPPGRLLLIAALATACASHGGQDLKSAYPPLEPSELGSMHNVSVSDGIWFGGAPSAEDLDLAHRRGVERVIALCGRGLLVERNLASISQGLGMEFIELGLVKDEEIPPQAVDTVIALLADESHPRTLMFCEDGSQSATLFAIHRAINDGMPVDEAVVEARRSGMRPGPPEEFVRHQVTRLRSAPAR